MRGFIKGLLHRDNELLGVVTIYDESGRIAKVFYRGGSEDDVEGNADRIIERYNALSGVEFTGEADGWGKEAVDALRMVLDAYNAGPDPQAVRSALDGAIDYVRQSLARVEVQE